MIACRTLLKYGMASGIEGATGHEENFSMKVACFVAISVGTSAWADTTVLLQKGNWSVNFVTGDSVSWCEAKTTNSAGQTFDLTLFDTDTFTMYVFDDRWSIRKRAISFILDIDYKRWNMDGSADGNMISVSPDDPQKAGEFLNDLKRGSAVALYNADEYRLATFSLSGSGAAVDVLFECWDQIGGPRSPGNSEDPFASVTDPFL